MSDTLVVKLGGTTIAEARAALAEIAAISRKRPVVVVHGGGKRLTAWLDRLGVESHFSEGRRVTDDAALEVALGVLGGVVNGELVAALRDIGAASVGVRGIDGGTLVGQRAGGLGRVVAEPMTDPGLLRSLLKASYLPVVATLGFDSDGIICNINADDAASSISSALGGELILMTDTDGVMGADGQRIEQLDAVEAERLIDAGVIEGGMVPKVRCAVRALRAVDGAVLAHIADGRGTSPISRALDGTGGTAMRAI